MKHIGIPNHESIITIEQFNERIGNRIRESVKAYRRKVRENVLPDLEELAFMNNSYKLVNGNIVTTAVNNQPQVYLGLGTYKIVISARSSYTARPVNIVVNLNRRTSPTSGSVVINKPLKTEFQTFEYEFAVDRLGTYAVLARPSSRVDLEMERFELQRVDT